MAAHSLYSTLSQQGLLDQLSEHATALYNHTTKRATMTITIVGLLFSDTTKLPNWMRQRPEKATTHLAGNPGKGKIKNENTKLRNSDTHKYKNIICNVYMTWHLTAIVNQSTKNICNVAVECIYESHVFSRSVAMTSAECNRCSNWNAHSNQAKGLNVSHGWSQSGSRYDMRRYFNVHSKADIIQLNLPHRTNN